MIPKFRAWLKDVKRMVDVEFLDLSHKMLIGNDWEYGMTESIKFDEVALMQFTGIFDENGVEIFEGDIVQTTRFVGRADWKGGFYEYDKDYRGIVKMLEGCWLIDTGTDSINLWSEIEENIIIGNIYANPGLMGVSK